MNVQISLRIDGQEVAVLSDSVAAHDDLELQQIDQRARRLTVSMRDKKGNMILNRQVATQPDKMVDIFNELTRCRASGPMRS